MMPERAERLVTEKEKDIETIVEGSGFNEEEIAALYKEGRLKKEIGQLENLAKRTQTQEEHLQTVRNELASWLTERDQDSIFLSAMEKRLAWEEKIEAALLVSPPAENFKMEDPDGKEIKWETPEREFSEERAHATPVEVEQLRLYLHLILPGPLRRFFDQKCVIVLARGPLDNVPEGGAPRNDLDSPNHTGGITIRRFKDKWGDEEDGENEGGEEKYKFICDSSAFIKRVSVPMAGGGQGEVAYVDINQFGLTFIKALLRLMPPQTKTKEQLNEGLTKRSGLRFGKDNILSVGENEEEAAEDYLAYAIVNRADAQFLSPDAAKTVDEFISLLDEVSAEELNSYAHEFLVGHGDKFTQQRLQLNPQLNERLRQEARKQAKYESRKNRVWSIPVMPSIFGVQLRIGWIGWYRSDWYERAKAEVDDKEAARILKREEHVTYRDFDLARAFLANDEDQARWILLSDTATSDYLWVRMEAFLYKFDSEFRNSHGARITKENMQFLMRLHRGSEHAKVRGSKPGEYVLSEDETHGVYVPYDQQVLNGHAEQAGYSERELLGAAKEMDEWWHYNKDGRLINIQDKIGDPSTAPQGLATRYGTGDLRELLGEDCDAFLQFNVDARRATGDAKFGTKLDPFRLSYLIHLIEFANTPDSKVPYHEHTKGSQLRLIGAFAKIPEAKMGKLGPEISDEIEQLYSELPENQRALVHRAMESLETVGGNGGSIFAESITRPDYTRYTINQMRRDWTRAEKKLDLSQTVEKLTGLLTTIFGEQKSAADELARHYCEKFIDEIFSLPKDKLANLDNKQLGKKRSELMDDLRQNISPEWYEHNQYKAQQWIEEVFMRIPEIRAAINVEEFFSPYLESSKGLIREEEAKEAIEFIEGIEKELLKDPSRTPSLKMNNSIRQILDRIGIGTREIEGAISLGMEGSQQEQSEEQFRMLRERINNSTFKFVQSEIEHMARDTLAVINRPQKPAPSELEKREKDLLSLAVGNTLTEHFKKMESRPRLERELDFLGQLKLVSFAITQRQEIIKRELADKEAKKKEKPPEEEVYEDTD